MDYKFLFYIFLSIVSITGGSFYLFKAGMATTGAIYFFGMLVIAIVFGLRWFYASGDLTTTPSGTWPPMINYCPDFLTLYKDESGEHVCVDTIGVSTALTKWDGNADTLTENHKFPLHTDKTGDARVTALCTSAEEMKVAWEGVFDGLTCIGNEPPMPPTSS